jgi:hypothetical protein
MLGRGVTQWLARRATKLSLGGNTVIKLFPPRETLVSYIAAGDGNVANLFVTVYRTAARSANH